MPFGHAFGREEEAVAHGRPSDSNIKDAVCPAAVSVRDARTQWHVRGDAEQRRSTDRCRSERRASAHGPAGNAGCYDAPSAAGSTRGPIPGAPTTRLLGSVMSKRTA